MSAHDLTDEEVLRLTGAFVSDTDAPGRFLRGVRDSRATGASDPILLGSIGLLAGIRARLTAIPSLAPEVALLTRRLTELDREEHDPLVRMILDAMTAQVAALKLGGELEASVAASACLQRVFPRGLALVSASYLGSAGAAEERARHAADLERHFGSVVVGGRNVPTWIAALNAVGADIGGVYRARIALAPDSAIPSLDDLRRLRRQAIALVEQLKFTAELAGAPEREVEAAFAEWETACTAAGRRRRAAEEQPATPPAAPAPAR